MRKTVAAIVVAAMVYVVAYVGFRQTHIQVWSRNGRPYVIFPAGNLALYYAFRPVSCLDSKLTGMGFHIGEHRKAPGGRP